MPRVAGAVDSLGLVVAGSADRARNGRYAIRYDLRASVDLLPAHPWGPVGQGGTVLTVLNRSACADCGRIVYERGGFDWPFTMHSTHGTSRQYG